MIRSTVKVVALAAEAGLRASHFTEATLAVQQDWQAITHGIAHPETVFAMFVIADTAVRIIDWCVSTASKLIEARRAAKDAMSVPCTTEAVPDAEPGA